MRTITTPPAGTSPAVLTYAAKAPLRVVARNVGAVNVFFAFETGALFPEVTSASFTLPPGGEETFVLAPSEGLYAVALAATGLISIATSEAYPIDPSDLKPVA